MARIVGTPRPLAACRLAAMALALGAVLGTRVSAQPAPFSGFNCSLTTCDCNCIAAEERRGDAALAKLEVDLPAALTLAPGRLPPRAAVARLELLNRKIGELLFLLQVARTNPAGPLPLSEVRAGLTAALRELQLPPPPAGWDYDERYLDSVANSIRGELDRATANVEAEAVVRQEIDTCRRWADHKQCDPSLGAAGERPALLPAPPRSLEPAPGAETPPRELPPSDGPLPLGRHADGRPYMNDELISRYVAASQAKHREGGAYWRHGRMGQADYDEISSRLQEWFRHKDTPEERLRRFDTTEQEALTRRAVDVTKAYWGDW